MQYLLTIYGDESASADMRRPSRAAQMMAAYTALGR